MRLLQVFDARMMRKLAVLRGHQADVTCAVWHPWHEDLLVSGSYDGSILHWLVSHPSEPQVCAAPALPGSTSDSRFMDMQTLVCLMSSGAVLLVPASSLKISTRSLPSA